MSCDKKEEKKSSKIIEEVNSYTLIKKEDSGVRFRRSIALDENSGTRIKPKETTKKEK